MCKRTSPEYKSTERFKSREWILHDRIYVHEPTESDHLACLYRQAHLGIISKSPVRYYTRINALSPEMRISGAHIIRLISE